jgi:hypothetical protein
VGQDPSVIIRWFSDKDSVVNAELFSSLVFPASLKAEESHVKNGLGQD